MMSSDLNKIGKAIETLRIRAFLRDIDISDIAKKVKQDRHTVSKKLKKTDMSLSDFCAYSRAVGDDPIRLLSDVFEWKGKAK